jgi:hypothetical protein
VGTASVEFDSETGRRTALLKRNATRLRRFLKWYWLRNVLHRVALPAAVSMLALRIITIAPYHYYGGGLSLVLVVLLVVLLLRR